jgi:hypothetical protein
VCCFAGGGEQEGGVHPTGGDGGEEVGRGVRPGCVEGWNKSVPFASLLLPPIGAARAAAVLWGGVIDGQWRLASPCGRMGFPFVAAADSIIFGGTVALKFFQTAGRGGGSSTCQMQTGTSLNAMASVLS